MDYLLFTALALIWSSSFLFIKLAIYEVPPLTMTAVRLVMATFLLWLWMTWRRDRFNAGLADWGKFCFIGLIGNVLPFVLISTGEKTVDSGMAAILMGIMPITTVLLAHYLIPDEPFSHRKAIGITLGFTGVITVVGWDALGGFTDDTLGQITILGAALCYALTTLFVRRTTTLSGSVMAVGSQLCGSMLIVPLALLIDRPWELTPSSIAAWSVVYLGLFPSAIATLIYFRIIANLGASTMSQVNFVIPILGALWGILFLGESLRLSAFVALGLVVIGVIFVNWDQGTSRKARISTNE